MEQLLGQIPQIHRYLILLTLCLPASVFYAIFLRNYAIPREARKFFTHVFTQFRREAPKFFYALFFTHFRREAPKKYITQYFLRIFRREAPPILRTFCTLFRFLNGFYALYVFLVVYFQRKAPPIFTHFFYAFSPRSGGRKILRTFFTHFLRFSREARKIFYAFFNAFTHFFFQTLKKTLTWLCARCK